MDDPPRLTTWVPDRPPGSKQAALHRLAAAMRRMNELLMDTDLAEEDLLREAEAAEQIGDRIAAGPGRHALWGYAETANAGDTRANFDQSPLVGRSNAVAPPLTLRVVEGGVEGTGNFSAAYEGPPGHVHGGIVAAAFDEVLGMVQSMSGKMGMTGTLTVRYRRPTPLHRDLTFRARVERVEGRKIFTSGTLHDGETLCAEAEGVFISVDFSRLREMAPSER
jgi:acyl-coenzyme A thioesterase PaaI-like protein